MITDLPRSLVFQRSDLARHLDAVVVVIPAGFAGVNAASRLIKPVTAQKPDLRILLVVSDLRRDAGLSLKDIRATIGHDIVTTLPRCDTLVFARGLRAGCPVSSSLAIVFETSKGPLFREFSRCHNEICMGTTLPESLARLEARVPTAEVSFFTLATTLQAETGGNLIETIESLAAQLRERRKLRKKARALSSEARASAVVLAALSSAAKPC